MLDSETTFTHVRCFMKVPEHLRIPLVVFSIEAVLLIGASLIFIVLRPPFS